MEALYLLIPLSVLIIIGVSWVFLTMASQGQFDDLDSPAQSILLDDDRARTPASSKREDDQAHTLTPPQHNGHAQRAEMQQPSTRD
jgi:cbb3-type cytochrome oxidase maturation protein